MEWTSEKKDVLRSLCAKGATLAQIKAAMSISKTTALKWILKLGIDRAVATPWRATQDVAQSKPPGHPISWGAITKGTLLEGYDFFGNPLDTTVVSSHSQAHQKEFPNEQQG